MNKRSFPIFLLSCALVVAGGVAYMLPAASDPTPNRVLLLNSGGRVVFDHTLHTDKAKIDCADCHHEINITSGAGPEDIISCGSCHIRPEDTNFIQAHQALYDAPDGGNSCLKCHHTETVEDSTVMGSVAGASFQPCSSCHPDTPSRKDAFHKNCFACHEKVNQGPGAKECAKCHTAK